MKQSHYVTPRTMQECTFQASGQAIHHDGRRRFDPQDRAVMWAAAIMFVIAMGVIYFYPQVTA